jgi:hypothetical protein
MTNLRRVKVNYTGASVTGPAVSRFHFTTALGSDQSCVDAVAAYFEAIDGQLSGTLSWASDSLVEYFDIATGETQSLGSTTPFTGTGSGDGQQLPLTTQGLISWRTGAYLAGREIRGRTFVPGFTETGSDAGRPTSGVISAMVNAAAALVAETDIDFVVWTKTHGTAAVVVGADVWSEWASLRSRRD